MLRDSLWTPNIERTAPLQSVCGRYLPHDQQQQQQQHKQATLAIATAAAEQQPN